MAYCRGRDFLFCELCGNLLALGSLKYAKCTLCGFKRSLKEFEGKETRYTVTAEDIRRELKIEPFVKLEGTSFDMGEFKKPLINRTCPKCQHPQLEYTTRQMRSADEGQTTFYECPMRCGYTDVDG